ncbi:hypothetical protein CHS0354_000422 [Potamilus streckersoni]|uniref:Aldehyde oxidase/xanthine dehydrogenase a/b hammerhead domain-containing protein n=1 Tax=Potamilus streckersoni TaxID=2493646 RepID=A0AAE0T6Q6_9BIVA|nr:hypothetical protein CHS0354_000422 [Potamilus streckersoni]
MPMIVAEELDANWENIIVEQAPLNTTIFKRQLAGGSQSVRQGWQALRMAGATARRMLVEAAATAWNVPVNEITTSQGMIENKKNGQSASYGEMASAASKIPVPKEVQLKSIKDFKIIGTSKNNVDGKNIVTGKPLFGIDYRREGMFIAMIVHPPAFGLKLKSFDDTVSRSMPGIKDIIKIKVYENQDKNWSDATAFNELVVVVGKSTWEVLNAKKALKLEWEKVGDVTDSLLSFTGDKNITKYPGALESTEMHKKQMEEFSKKKGQIVRKDGDPERAFKNASHVIERSYSAPFLAHNTMEPMNFFAHVQNDKVELVGPIQTPEFMEKSVSARLGIPLEKIDIQMTRMGGGFGRRLYGHYLVEAALISQKMQAPIKLIYTREDDMTHGNYRPTYYVTYRAAFDANKNLTAFHVKAGGIPESPIFPNRFPAGAVENYLVEEWKIDSNIVIGAFRAPRSNFIAGAEQSFIDEIAEFSGKDPIDFRLELLENAKKNKIGQVNDYVIDRLAGVLQLVKEKSHWGKQKDVHQGVSAYFCHDSYVANVVDMVIENGKSIIKKIHCAVDCGIVVNPISAINLVEGGSIDAVGHALYSGLTFKDGEAQEKNFDRYKLIRHSDAPKKIEVHFVKNEIDPTGLGEPPFPPVIGALANAMYKAYGKRFYHQPFLGECASPEPTKYTITFNSNGGSNIANIIVISGNKASKPTNPTRTGYTFVAWYKEAEFSNAWTEVTTVGTIFSARSAAQLVVFTKSGGTQKMYLIGGHDVNSTRLNDVRSSADGSSWVNETANSTSKFTERYLNSALVFNNKMWVIGGADGTNKRDDVWSSSDGGTWTQEVENASFLTKSNSDKTARSDFSTIVFDKKIYLWGGK